MKLNPLEHFAYLELVSPIGYIVAARRHDFPSEVPEAGRSLVHRLRCASVACHSATTTQVNTHPIIRRVNAYQSLNVLEDQRVGVVQLVQGDVDNQVLL